MASQIVATLFEKRAYIHGFFMADHNVIAARAQGIPWSNGNVTRARMAEDLQPARYTPAVQIAVVQLVLPDDVVVETIEVLFRQQLSCKEARTAEAFELSAGRTGHEARIWHSGGCCRNWHNYSPDWKTPESRSLNLPLSPSNLEPAFKQTALNPELTILGTITSWKFRAHEFCVHRSMNSLPGV